ncbi:MAG: hypothetical protein JWM87_783 [Candidatus Eremiobacteraeota bacterium]|nr:hypothetical protein [Candidatus Eremiobacteraeota bacterium]
MTLLRVALHYAGATAVLFAATRLASALPGGKPSVVRLQRVCASRWMRTFYLDGDPASVTSEVGETEEVVVYRFLAYPGILVRETYRERSLAERGEPSEALFFRAEARAARGERPEIVEAA